jgi:hypothetical protein
MKRLTDILKKQELTDEQIAAITKAMTDGKVYVAGEENLDLRYSKLNGEHETAKSELGEANKLIADLKKNQTADETVQAKITDYETKIADLTAENEAIKIEAALGTALRDGGAQPDSVEFLIYKIREKGEVKLDDTGKVSSIEDTIKDLKTKFAPQFISEGEGDKTGKVYDAKKLKDGEGASEVSKEAFNKLGYKARLELKQKDPEAYAKLARGAEGETHKED